MIAATRLEMKGLSDQSHNLGRLNEVAHLSDKFLSSAQQWIISQTAAAVSSGPVEQLIRGMRAPLSLTSNSDSIGQTKGTELCTALGFSG